MSKAIKYLVMDVDGTLTDGKIYMGTNGEALKAFDIKDGYGIHDILPLQSIVPVIITGRCSTIVENRCKELGITEIHQGIKDKAAELTIFCQQHSIQLSECAYIGDDLNDLPCMQLVKEAGGIVGCPVDAVEQVQKIADFKSRFHGGCGAVREYIDWIIK